MSQLTTQTQAITAYQSPRVRDMADSELFKIIGQQAQKVCAFSGQVLPDNPTMFAALVAASIKDTGCTIEQFKIAVHEGMTNTEIYSANAPATYNKWVRQYLDRVKMEIASYRSKVMDKPKEEPTEAEKMRNAIEHILSMYDKWQAGHEFVDGGSAGFLWLEKIREIPHNVQERNKMFNDSHEKAIAAIAARKQEVNKYEARSIQSVLDKIHSGDDVDELRFEKIKICRNDLLKQYFMANDLTFEYLKTRYEASGS
jgi:HPt (histidine-containing phosphotransfer) domain-containing protein